MLGSGSDYRSVFEVGDVGTFAGEDILVELLFVMDEGNAGVEIVDFLVEIGELCVEHTLALGDGVGAGLAEADVGFHFVDAHAASFEAVEVFDPLDAVVVEDAVVLSVTLDIGNEADVAIEF